VDVSGLKIISIDTNINFFLDMSLNKTLLIGHVGQMEIKSFDGQNGPRKCATFSLATTERYRDRSGNIVNNTEWHNIVSWNHA
jgi:single-strand DNA-binding protein